MPYQADRGFQSCLKLASPLGPVEKFAYGLYQKSLVERFRQMPVKARRTNPSLFLDAHVTGESDRGHLTAAAGRQRSDLFYQIVAVHFGHPQIADENVGTECGKL